MFRVVVFFSMNDPPIIITVKQLFMLLYKLYYNTNIIYTLKKNQHTLWAVYNKYYYSYMCKYFGIFLCFWKKHILCSPRLHLFDQKRTVFYLLYLKMYFIPVIAKLIFQQSLLQSSVSCDPSEIILICWYDVHMMLIIIINVENGCTV